MYDLLLHKFPCSVISFLRFFMLRFIEERDIFGGGAESVLVFILFSSVLT